MRVALVATPVWATRSPPLTATCGAAGLARLGHEVHQLHWNIELHHDAPDPLSLACEGNTGRQTWE